MPRSSLISPEIQQQFDADGAVCLRGVFSQHWIDTVAKGIETNMASPGIFSESIQGVEEEGKGVYFNDLCNWNRIPEFKDFVFNSPAAEIAGTLTKSKLATFYHEHVLVKEPSTSKLTPWHQDQSYYPIDGLKVCSIWMPIDPVPKENSIQFVKGSHRWGRWFYPRKFLTERNYNIENLEVNDRIYEDVPNIDGNLDKVEILVWDVEPGDCVVFHMMLLHGVAGNSSPSAYRRVLATRWLGDDTTLACRPWTVSPPIFGGLQVGDPTYKSDSFPVIWRL